LLSLVGKRGASKAEKNEESPDSLNEVHSSLPREKKKGDLFGKGKREGRTRDPGGRGKGEGRKKAFATVPKGVSVPLAKQKKKKTISMFLDKKRGISKREEKKKGGGISGDWEGDLKRKKKRDSSSPLGKEKGKSPRMRGREEKVSGLVIFMQGQKSFLQERGGKMVCPTTGRKK